MSMKFKIILVIILVLAGFFFYNSKKGTYDLANEAQAQLASGEEQKKTSTLPFILPFLKTDLQKTIDKGGNSTFLILGYGGEGHSGGFLTDTIILGRMNFSTGEVTMMNLPRDLWVDGQKINVMYAVNQDAPKVTQLISQKFDIPIDYYLTLDFDGFRQAVDEMGGLDIYVEKTFDDYNYPRNDNDQIDAGVMHIRFDEGWETMDGERALQYARSRYSADDGGDYNRSRRQQKVIEAFKGKLLSTKDLRVLFPVIKTLSSHFKTNFPMVEGITLYNYSKKHQITTKSKIISDQNYLYFTYNDEGSFILLPQNDDWSVFKKYFEGQLPDNPNAAPETSSDQ